MSTSIRVASGLLVDLADIRPADILMSDIATSLAHQERFTGHCPLRPTVAQHSLAVEHIASYLMPDELSPLIEPCQAANQLSRAAFMHDAAEAYVSDLSAPAKRRLRQLDESGYASGFDAMEAAAALAVNTRFGCSTEGWSSLVHEADVLAYYYEAAYGNWSPYAAAKVPAWLWHDLYVRRCYGTADGGLAAFLRRARALGMHDDA